jgi:hypothetical protein
MKEQYDKKQKPSQQYQKGDRVYLDAANIKTTRASKKLDVKFHGPFKILEPVDKSAYRLKLPESWKIHKLKLKRAHKPVFPQQKEKQPNPPPELIDGNKEYEVEEVQGSWHKNGTLQFLVKWKGQPQEESTWEPEEHIGNMRCAVCKHYKKRPDTI